ncbi:MAG: DUF1549 and DUF1553 domain-containing protein [Gemmataceae bacterium]|nr:DUF1549 and DUF1553 domain-containing protein [Gemmataceae bacterium]
MTHLGGTARQRCCMALGIVGLAALLLVGDPSAQAQFKKGAANSTEVAPPAPKSALLTSQAWKDAPMKPVSATEIDQLIAKELQQGKLAVAPLTTDEQFIRRVTLDLTGKLPSPADISDFSANKDSEKRAKLIDKLLDSEDYAKHWAKYWRYVISSRVVDRRGQILARAFDQWMTEQLKENKNWAEITRGILTAGGQARFDKPTENGAAFFLLSYTGTEGPNDRAAETSRIFLGIQIRCAQCHDHPFDQWKQVQFHEMAGYYARLRDRFLFEEQRIVGFELTSVPNREQQMPGKDDPRKTLTTHPRFLDGKAPDKGLADKDRRKALTDAIVDKENYWFAGAYVNRMWGELMGQSFYQPVDEMGPLKEAIYPSVLTRLASSFRATDYDMKGLLRVVMNTQTYQRQIRLGGSSDEHLRFAASYPKQLGADALYESLQSALGTFGRGGAQGPRPGGGFGFGGRLGFEFEFKRLFEFDPSLKPDEVEASIAQALMMMNNPQINGRISAKGETPLAKILSDHEKDEDAIEAVYLRTLARKPTARELDKCKAYVKNVGNRAEAFEDILWALINSTEFQTKR